MAFLNSGNIFYGNWKDEMDKEGVVLAILLPSLVHSREYQVQLIVEHFKIW